MIPIVSMKCMLTIKPAKKLMMNSFGNYSSIDLFKKKKNFLNLEFELSLLLSEAVLKLLSIDSFSPFYPLL
jgi:hypothetical protein